MNWQPIETAPKDGTWILGINNRGNQAVLIWEESAPDIMGEYRAGWIHPFSDGRLSSFWNGGCGSVATHWMPLPAPPPKDPDAERIRAALDLAIRYGQIDGEHHKTWVIDQVVRILAGDKYDAIIAESNTGEDGPDTYGWETGIAP